ncbi:MAG: hypothetical protein HOO88_04035 [Kiritimatiellaceae bacterium]|nr:hypothetical protein [Kiritimatiellaceae bacterium]
MQARTIRGPRHLPSDTAKLYASVVDHLTPEKRSWNMSRIRGRDTTPEVLVRSMLHRRNQRSGVRDQWAER